jgi:hypothetical protein
MPLGSLADTPATVRVSDAKLLGWEQRPQSTGMVRGERGSTISSPLRYCPRVYGFRVNEIAKLRRRQEAMHDSEMSSSFRHDDADVLKLARVEQLPVLTISFVTVKTSLCYSECH